ncbi:MAG: aminoglycoside 3'-phosphotransferase [Clostridiales bacterium]|nr:aminoglycoside 3'-phosphotransferase [Clostridiales bacterium]
MKEMFLPSTIAKLLGNQTFRADSIGMSSAGVFIYDNAVLKVQHVSNETTNEQLMLKFLSERKLAPDVIVHEVVDNTDFILMDKCKGKMLCDRELMNNPSKLMEIASGVLRKLWSIDIASCPVDMSLKYKLKLAEYNVTHNLVALDNVDPSTFGASGRFQDPYHLLKWLVDNQPREELVVTHGDFCLPNVFFDGVSAKVIDVGRGGVADKYQDVALLYRSLRDNLRGCYGGEYLGELDDQMFFSVLGITPDWDKIDYYILLDELF